jgi:hypothetical protein
LRLRGAGFTPILPPLPAPAAAPRRAAPSAPLVLAAALAFLAAAVAPAHAGIGPASLGSAPPLFVKARYSLFPLYAAAGQPADFAVRVQNSGASPATPGTIRIFFTANRTAWAESGAPPGFGVCGSPAAAMAFTPPSTPIKAKGTVDYTIPGVPVPAYAPAYYQAFVMVEPGAPHARRRRRR